MSAYKDLTGKTYGRLTAISRGSNNKYGRARFLCLCECGNRPTVDSAHLLNGHTISCGCAGSRGTLGARNRRHGKTDTRLYKIWTGMKDRTTRKLNPAYGKYGGRGIKVCDRWRQSFERFEEDMGGSYAEHVEKYGAANTSIERADNDKGYSPDNCRWATRKEQARNRTSSRIVSYLGVDMTVAEFSEMIGVSNLRVGYQVRMGLSPAQIVAKFAR